jgi:hypothetical protein
VWLASPAYSSKYWKTYSSEVPSNQPLIFVQTLTTTQPEEIKGKHGQGPQHNPTFLQKLLWEGWPKGNCITVAEWSLFLFCQKITSSVWSCLQSFLIFVLTCFSLVGWLIMQQDFLCQKSLLVNKIKCFLVFMTCLHFVAVSCK